jgi:hypothetical protein
VIVCVFRFDMTGHNDKIQIPVHETTYSTFSKTNLSESVIGQDQDICTIITESQQHLDAIMHEILDLDTVMHKIQHHRQLLVEKQGKIIHSMTLYKGLLSALWRLPVEVLSQIFVHCLPEAGHLEVSSKLAPVLLTRICRRWREVAIDMPVLWCKLSVDGTRKWGGRGYQAAGFCFCYDSWLKRSRGRPLSLSLRYCNGDEPALRSLLQPYMNQISSIVFHDIQEYQRLALDLPVLQELTIKNLSDDSPADAQSISRLPSTLESLRLRGMCRFNFPQSCSSNPVWAHLTDLEIPVSNLHTFLRLLQLGPNLSSAMVSLPPTDSDVVLPASKPFTHTKLQSLSICCSPWATPSLVPDLFNALSLPNLRVLDASRAKIWWPHEKCQAFLEQSKCPLEKLILEMGHEQRAGYVALIPSLEIVGGS